MSGRELQPLDLSVGETELVSSSLGLDRLTYRSNSDSRMYQPVGGLPSLVGFLEKKYNKHVVIVNGAKQGVHACLNLMKSLDKRQVNVVHPFWGVFNHTFKQYPEFKVSSSFEKHEDSFNFIVSPNNPDGSIFTQELHNFTIHDAVYNLDYFTDNVIKNLGDIQIYSASKMLGVSGYRCGWILTDNINYKEYLAHYVEEYTVGVSAPSQSLVLDALEILDNVDTSVIKDTLLDNKRKLIEALKPYGSFENTHSIFLYGKLEKKLPEEIVVASYPDNYVRINCCYSPLKIEKVIHGLSK